MKYIKKYFFNSIILIFVMLFSPPSIATKVEFQLGYGLMNFNYTEYDDNVFLDGESGLIPGVVLKLKLDNRRIIYAEFVGQLYANTIKYDGQTQAGTPVKTDSDAVIFDRHFKLGLYPSRARNHGPYIGLGHRYWFRNIHSGQDINGGSVAGLLEQYYWDYTLIGYSGSFHVSEKIKMGFDVRHTHMFNAKMDVDFLGFNNYDDAQVNLGNEAGVRFAVPVQIKMTKSALFVTPYYEIIDIGKSNTVPITTGGAATGFVIHEPRSETRNVGIEMTWLW